MPEQSLSHKETDGEITGVQRLASGKAILPWLLTLWPVAKVLYQSLNLASVAEFAAGLGGNPHMKMLIEFALSPLGLLLTTLTGLAWLTYLAMRKPKQLALANPNEPEQLPAASEAIACESPETHAQVEADKANIKNLVRVCAIYYISHFDSNERLQRFIDFTFFIFNLSLHDIIISEALPGDIQFGIQADTFSRSREIDGKKPKLCRARSGCNLTVRQYVDKEEIAEIEAADNMYFWLANLGITFKLAQEPEGDPIPLRTDQTLETKKAPWRVLDQPEYVFTLNEEQWAEVIKGKSLEMVKDETELRAEITALSSQNDSLKRDIAYEKQSAGKQMDTYKENMAKLDGLVSLWGPIMGYAQEQARAINNWVVMKEAKLESLQLWHTPRLVVIAIRILNESIYKITINHKDIKGRLHFKARPLGGEPVGENVTVPINVEPIEDLEPRCPALLILEQPVTETQAETILAAQKSSDPNGLFSLTDVQIPISVKTSPEPVDVRSLRISSEYEHLYINDFGKTTIASTLDKAVQAIVEADRANVSKSVFVAVRGVNFDLLMSEKRLDFMFEVFNGSVFPVSISARSNGFVQHDGKHLSQYTVFDPAQSDDLERGKSTVVTLRHERIEPEKCSALQADFDAGKPITFDFGGLTLPVRITDPNETGKLSNLQLPDGIAWRKGSIFGRIVKLSTSVNSTTDTKLKTD